MCALKVLSIPAFFLIVLLVISSAAVSCALADTGANQKSGHFHKGGHFHSSLQGSEGVTGRLEDVTGPSQNSPGVEVAGPELRRMSYISAATGVRAGVSDGRRDIGGSDR